MSLQINTNIAAMQAINSLNNNNTKLSNTLNSLSTGLRLTSAAVDPSGMTIADSLNFQATNLGQAISNGNDTVNLINIADQALQQSINLVTTIAQQATQAANATQDGSSRQALQNNINGLLAEINNIAATTSYKGVNLLDGSFVNKIVQIGAYQNQTIGIGIQNTSANAIGWVANKTFNTTAFTTSTTESSAQSNQTLAYNQANNLVYYQGTDLTINGVNVGDKAFGQNKLQQMDAGTFAAAINSVSAQTGVTATANTTVTGTTAIQAGTISAGTFMINGVNMGTINVAQGDTNGNLVNTINQFTAQTGVVASVNGSGQLVLTNTTGGNIAVKASTNVTNLLGINDSTTKVSGANNIATAFSFYLNGTKISLKANTSAATIAAAINQQLTAAGVNTQNLYASATAATGGKLVIRAINGNDLNIRIASGQTAASHLSLLGITAPTGFTNANTSAINFLANSSNHGQITLTSDNTITVGGNAPAIAGMQAGTYSPNVNLSNVDVTNQNSAGLAITIANSALSALDKIRASLGSVENQINATVQNIQVAQVNVTQAKSAITDTNFGTETSKFATLQVLAQAGTYALAQSNATQQLVLRLMQ